VRVRAFIGLSSEVVAPPVRGVSRRVRSAAGTGWVAIGTARAVR